MEKNELDYLLETVSSEVPSPDGRRRAVSGLGRDIVIVGEDGTRRRISLGISKRRFEEARFGWGEYTVTMPVWSPSGTALGVTVVWDDGERIIESEIYRVEIPVRGPVRARRISPAGPGRPGRPRWAGRRLGCEAA